MKKYDSFKDSGVEWIGYLPSNWQIKRIKHTTYVKGRIGWQGMRSDEFLESSDSYVVTGTDFMKGLVKWETCYQVPIERYEEDPFIQLREGDLLITKDGTIGKIAVVKDIPKIATLNSGVFLTRPLFDSYVPEFMYWILYSEVFKTFYDYNKSGSTIQHLYQNVFNEFMFPLPTIKEQTAIADYLDHKTTQIDHLIAKKEQFIQLLEEERVAVINQAVTKGLDPTVPMKDSGIDWLGEIPEHWEVKKLKHITSKVTDGSHFSPPTESEGRFYISVTDITKSNSINFEYSKRISDNSFDELARNGCKPIKGDILITKDGTIGRGVIVEDFDDFVILSSLGLIRLNNKQNPYYILFYLLSGLNIDQMYSNIRGSGITRLTIKLINDLIVVVPSFEEQIEIENYLKLKTNEIDKIIIKSKQEIELLNEYKTALISEVVTGKVDVRNEKLN